jgi:ribose 5-phosphate isomerase B
VIYFGSDHAGFALKQFLVAKLAAAGITSKDLGTHDESSCDYPDYALAVARTVAEEADALGVLVCGTGTGVAIAANKVKGIRAAMCASELQARMAKSHNDINILCLGARLTGQDLAEAILMAYLDTSFAAGRHARRLDKIGRAEQE